MGTQPALHLICGLVAAGKTTLARELALELPAVRLSRDEWMLRLYGGTYDDPSYIEQLGPCTEMLWDVASDIVSAGVSVVLDWNFWSRDLRSDALQRASALGVDVHLHWLDIPLEVVLERARGRLNDQPDYTHAIDEAGVRHLASIFETPEHDERIAIVRHH